MGQLKMRGCPALGWLHVPSLRAQLSQACSRPPRALFEAWGAAGAWRSWGGFSTHPVRTVRRGDQGLSCCPDHPVPLSTHCTAPEEDVAAMLAPLGFCVSSWSGSTTVVCN